MTTYLLTLQNRASSHRVSYPDHNHFISYYFYYCIGQLLLRSKQQMPTHSHSEISFFASDTISVGVDDDLKRSKWPCW